MHQRGRVERVAGLLASHPPRRELAKLVVNQGQELIRGFGIAGFDRVQDLCNIGHGDRVTDFRRRVTTTPALKPMQESEVVGFG